jgi:hypothetical protein
MHCRSPLFQALAATGAALFLAASQASPKPLDDAEMSGVRGADGSILASMRPATSKSDSALASGLAAAFASSTGASLLAPTQFAMALEGVGLAPAMFPDYAGQPVAQTVVDARPVTFSFNASDIVQATTGAPFNAAPGTSLGTITLKDFDARGTTIWVWHH